VGATSSSQTLQLDLREPCRGEKGEGTDVGEWKGKREGNEMMAERGKLENWEGKEAGPTLTKF